MKNKLRIATGRGSSSMGRRRITVAVDRVQPQPAPVHAKEKGCWTGGDV